MEAYKSHCPTCGVTYFWTGYKTGLGKTPEQLAAMRRRETTCRECGTPGLRTTLDRESEVGRKFDAMDAEAASMIATILRSQLGGGS